jgi:AraC-like DNA-binding protein
MNLADHPRAACDHLSEILADLRPLGVSYGHARMTAPWGIAFPAAAGARLHLVAQGRAFLRREGEAPLPLEAGDVVLLPAGGAHGLSHAPGSTLTPHAALPLQPIADRIFSIDHGGGGPRTLMVCAEIAFARAEMHPLVRLMPPVMHLARATRADPALQALVEAMAAEALDRRIGGATILTRLGDVIVTRIVRAWLERAPADAATGWLAAIRDPQVGRALAAFHARPDRGWTLATLARAAGMSRSVFAERFRAITGTSAGSYVATWRMHLARGWLHAEGIPVATAAARLGYASEAAFARAFRRETGLSPGQARRTPLADGAAR